MRRLLSDGGHRGRRFSFRLSDAAAAARRGRRDGRRSAVPARRWPARSTSTARGPTAPATGRRDRGGGRARRPAVRRSSPITATPRVRPIRRAYLHGVLCIDAVEISTNSGHYVALDMPAAPYPLGGEARDVVEDVARLGGFGVAAHPDSPKPELRMDGLDGAGRRRRVAESRQRVARRVARPAGARRLIDYLVRPGAGAGGAARSPGGDARPLGRADGERRAVVAVAGHDAHGGIGEGAAAASVGAPARRAVVRGQLSNVRDPGDSGRGAVGPGGAGCRGDLSTRSRHGRVFTAIDAVATPAFVDFRAARRRRATPRWGRRSRTPGAARVTVRATVPAGGRIVLMRERQGGGASRNRTS